jgi:hypothetical protein
MKGERRGLLRYKTRASLTCVHAATVATRITIDAGKGDTAENNGCTQEAKYEIPPCLPH